MKRIMIIVIVVLMLLMTGCESTADISVSDSKQETKEIISQKVENPKEVNPTEEVQDKEVISVVTKQPQEERRATEESKETTPPKNESKPKESVVVENMPEAKEEQPKVVIEEPRQEIEPEQPEIKEPQKEEVIESEPVEEVPKEEVVTFDIGYWIGFAKSYAVGRGLSLDSTATDCWDNPITANPNCIYLERDIKDRINHYVDVEGFESVWIWYENIGNNSYLIYIGYA